MQSCKPSLHPYTATDDHRDTTTRLLLPTGKDLVVIGSARSAGEMTSWRYPHPSWRDPFGASPGRRRTLIRPHGSRRRTANCNVEHQLWLRLEMSPTKARSCSRFAFLLRPPHGPPISRSRRSATRTGQRRTHAAQRARIGGSTPASRSCDLPFQASNRRDVLGPATV
jgi:hypothetical protein